MNNSVFGKTMEKLWKRDDVKLVTDEKKLPKLTWKPTYVSSKVFNENLVAVHKIKETLILNRPAYVGMCILDLSKVLTVADPERCHGFQETYENCQHKFNTIYKFCSWQKQQPRTRYFFCRGDNFAQIHVNSQETSCVEASCWGDWLFTY